MKYRVQHTGRGKLHLIDEETNVLCGSKGDFIHSSVDKLSFEDGKINLYSSTLISVNDEDGFCMIISDPFQYCKKCIKKMKANYHPQPQ